MMIWSGAGLHGTVLVAFFLAWVTGIDPDDSPAKFFLILAPVLFFAGIWFSNLSYNLQLKWADEQEEKGMGYNLNQLFSIMKCDFSHPPSVFWIPMPFLSIVSLIISFLCWMGVF